MNSVRKTDFSPEWTFQTSRSGGKGGQHVNKVESRVELYFSVPGSNLLTLEQKELVMQKLAGRISADGVLQLYSDEDRSQFKNKQKVIAKFYDLLEYALRKPKARTKTKPTYSSVQKRLEKKKMHSKKKEGRRNITD